MLHCSAKLRWIKGSEGERPKPGLESKAHS